MNCAPPRFSLNARDFPASWEFGVASSSLWGFRVRRDTKKVTENKAQKLNCKVAGSHWHMKLRSNLHLLSHFESFACRQHFQAFPSVYYLDNFFTTETAKNVHFFNSQERGSINIPTTCEIRKQ